MQEGEHQMGMMGWTRDNADPDNFLNTLLGCMAMQQRVGMGDLWEVTKAFDLPTKFALGFHLGKPCLDQVPGVFSVARPLATNTSGVCGPIAGAAGAAVWVGGL